jgi:hypothetical protein
LIHLLIGRFIHPSIIIGHAFEAAHHIEALLRSGGVVARDTHAASLRSATLSAAALRARFLVPGQGPPYGTPIPTAVGALVAQEFCISE